MREILKYLRDVGEANAKQIAVGIGRGRWYVDRRLPQLLTCGKIDQRISLRLKGAGPGGQSVFYRARPLMREAAMAARAAGLA